MKELLRRLFQSPRISLELLAISLVANLLALASPIFVMLVLGRYVTHGIDATLITLSFGMLLAIIMEFLFRLLRLRLARGLSVQANINLVTWDDFQQPRAAICAPCWMFPLRFCFCACSICSMSLWV
ncbi:MAG: hypothetical protein N4A65_14115 [Cohaesibacter sp.]|jgi:ABC-type bacteriocin/lantibiotic exporter with double-glycine peptidase domain|nr:hypothetical protein [Cohaesibacter sp.]